MTLVSRPFSFRTNLLFAALTLAAASAAAQKDLGPTSTTIQTQNVDHAASYYHYGLAKMYEEQAVQSGRQDLATQAIEQYKLALDADPNSRLLADGLANLYFALGRVREAVSAAQEQVNKYPDDIDAHMLLGRTYLRSLGNGQGQQSGEMLQAAIKEYETIAKLKPKDLETRVLLGQLYGLAHDSAKAEAQFKAAQQIDPSNEEVVLNLARLYTESGDLQKAAKVIADVPVEDRSARMDFALAGIYDQLKQPKDAAEAYRAVLNDDPDNADAKKGLAQALMQAGDQDGAAKVYSQILKSDPADPQALVRQAEIDGQAGKYEEALATLKKAEAANTDNGLQLEIHYNEGLMYDALGRFDEAVKAYKQALNESASTSGKYSEPEAHNRALFLDKLASVYREQGRTDDAVAAYKEMSALGGEFTARGVASEVDAYRDAHKWSAALDAAAQAAKQMPNNHDVQTLYARQLGDAGKVDEAVKLAEAQKTGKASEDRDAYLAVADIEWRAKRWKDASAAVDKAETVAPKSDAWIIAFYRGEIAERQKNYDVAEAEFRKGLAGSPDNPAIENYLGYMLADRGVKLDEAVSLLKKAVAAEPQNYAFLDSLAWAYYKQGQYALAESFARKAVARSGADPTVLDHLGEIEAKTGKLQEAINDWEKSLKAYASSLAPEADPADVAKVQKKLETARVKLAKNGGVK